MSAKLADSELSSFNASPAGKIVELSSPLMEVLRRAMEISARSDGAFDVTCRPVLQLWKQAGKAGRLPDETALRDALQRVGYTKIKLRETGAEKQTEGVSVDLGGIAKGYGIDRALEAIRDSGCEGGLVDVGGDIRCFGRSRSGRKWRIGIRNPFDPRSEKMLAVAALDDGAVCTSGNYFRFTEIDGRRYSHIVDPRTGRPVDAAPSVTVVAPTAITADAWATALSVLGADGLARLEKEEGVEAMMIVGGAENAEVRMTPGMEKLLVEPPTLPAEGNRSADE